MPILPGVRAAGHRMHIKSSSTGAWATRFFLLLLGLVALALTGARGWPTATVLAAGGGGGAAVLGVQPPVDTDGDGMPDDWETFFGLNPNVNDAAGDPDGDGLTNLQEYQQGGHPFGFQKRYFAEGALGFFRTDIGLVNNSTTETANVQLTYVTESGTSYTQRVKLLPMTRQTVSANSFLTGVGGGFGTIIESNIAIAADRFMEWGATGYGSSLSASVTAPSQTWYFAEGATGIFNLYYLLLNPSPTATAHVSIKYLQEIGPPVTRTYTVAPHTRETISVNDDLALLFTSAGAVVTADVPIVAERAMYLSSLSEVFSAGAAGAGATAPASDWYFAEGTPGGFFDEFILVANPNTPAAIVTVTYRRPDGVSASALYAVPGQSRATIYVNYEMAHNPQLAAVANSPVSAKVSSTRPIVAERTMWWPHNNPGGWCLRAASAVRATNRRSCSSPTRPTRRGRCR
jgi:Bacterial TSP3 repeat